MRDEQRGPYPPHASGWWTSDLGKGMCRSCGEERLVHAVTDIRGEQHFCRVCGNSWWITESAVDVSGRVLYE